MISCAESDEYTQNASKRISRTWQNPEFRQSRSEAVKKLWENEEYKKVVGTKTYKLKTKRDRFAK